MSVIRSVLINGITPSSGASTLIVNLVRVLNEYGYKTIGIEINSNELEVLNNDKIIYTSEENLGQVLLQKVDYDFAIIDGNGMPVNEYIDFNFDLLALSSIQIAKWKKRNAIKDLKKKSLYLNKSVLSKKEIERFEVENGVEFNAAIDYFNEYNFDDVVDAVKPILEIIEVIQSKKSKSFKLFKKE